MWTRKLDGACVLALLCLPLVLPWAVAAPAAEFVITSGNIPTKDKRAGVRKTRGKVQKGPAGEGSPEMAMIDAAEPEMGRGGGRREKKKRRPREDDNDRPLRAERAPQGRAGRRSGAPPLERRVAEAEGDIKLYPFGTMPTFKPKGGYAEHRPGKNAVLGALFSENMMGKDIKSFVGTARKSFDGDIVVAVNPGLKPNLLQILKDFEIIVYEIPLVCVSDGMGCTFSDATDMQKMPLAQLRYYLYWYWTRIYSKSSKVMISDTRDAIFQSDPFAYQTHEWQDSELVLFLESQPNKVINRCTYNSGWVRSCYGEEALKKIGHNPVSCSGVSMGSRNGILVYTMTVARHIDPQYRLIGSSVPKETENQGSCISKGMDQGIHNWLLHSGILHRMLNDKITVFEQGEGPVNTLGGLFGENKLIKLNMLDVGIFKKSGKLITIHNWNGKPSPVAHQFDRFSGQYFDGTQGIGVLQAYEGVF